MSSRPKHPQPVAGARYGRWTVVTSADPNAHGKARFVCQCDCGSPSKIIRASPLIYGKSLSCGCMAREMTSARSKTHGLTYSREWQAWQRVRKRCGKPGHYEHVAIDPRWDSFDAFLADMGPMPADKPTIDRIDNAKGYEPGNCRWASTTEQNRNKTSNVNLTYRGRTMTVAEWAREIGMSHSGLNDRLDKMTVEEALELPDQRGQRRWRNCA